jgi:hypothetical protein
LKIRDRRLRPDHAPLAPGIGKISGAETEESAVKPRKYRNIFNGAEKPHRDGTGWLGREDSNLRMAESKSDYSASNINTHFSGLRGSGSHGVGPDSSDYLDALLMSFCSVLPQMLPHGKIPGLFLHFWSIND